MTGRAALWLVPFLAFCEKSAPADPPRFREGPEGCNIEPAVNCGAGRLPRITEREWTSSEFEKMTRLSKEGTVAVDRANGATRVVPECRLGGTYSEARGERLAGRFWATNRVFFMLGELGPECESATHVVAAFAMIARESDARSDAGGASRAIEGARFSAILVPLPCPSITDDKPAKGCLGRGMTGPRRLERALEMRQRVSPDTVAQQDLTYPFEVYAMMPDDRRGLEYLARARMDCFLGGQIEAAGSTWPIIKGSTGRTGPPRLPKEWPSFLPENDYNCLYQPPFLACFPGIFDPAPGNRSCWALAHP